MARHMTLGIKNSQLKSGDNNGTKHFILLKGPREWEMIPLVQKIF